MILHRYNDGSILKIMSAKELITIPIWKGNRILDTAHAESIRKSVGDKIQQLDSNYSIIKYTEFSADEKPIQQTFLIDGQHRAYVLREYYHSNLCEKDFSVTVREKTVDTESDAVEYFNAINNVKKQHWKTDPNLLVNNYILALEKHFNKTKKTAFIRPNTNRPYLSVEKLRDVLLKNSNLLKPSSDHVKEFVEAVNKENQEGVEHLEIMSLVETKSPHYIDRAIALKFSLAVNPELLWVKKILTALQ